MKVEKAKCEIRKRKQTKTHFIQFQLFLFSLSPLVYRKIYRQVLSIRVFPWTDTLGDSVRPRKNTIASRDQLKPVTFRENLVVN